MRRTEGGSGSAHPLDELDDDAVGIGDLEEPFTPGFGLDGPGPQPMRSVDDVVAAATAVADADGLTP